MSELILRAQAVASVSETRHGSNYFEREKMPVGRMTGQPGEGPSIGLVQFAGTPCPLPGRIANARLRLFLIRAASRASILTAQASLDPFDPRTVTWASRPTAAPWPRTDFLADDARAGEYLEVDVTALIPGKEASFIGFTLSAKPERDNAALFSASECARPLLSLSVCEEPGPCCGFELIGLYRQHEFRLTGEGHADSPSVPMEDAERVTVFAKNSGGGDLVFRLQISPNGVDFLDDPQTARVAPGGTLPLTPYLFARYLRAHVENPCGGPVEATVTFQIQARACRMQ